MEKNLKPTPKVRDIIPAKKIAASIQEMVSFIQKNFDLNDPDVTVVGIQRRGATLASRLVDALKKERNVDIQKGALDITLYRDDFSTSSIQPIVGETHLDFDLDNKNIILVDDVLFSGRTIRAAIDELMDFGRPKSITLIVLVDRGHRELPIQADFAAMTLDTKRHESVNLHLQENDQKEEIVICEPI